MTPPPAVITTVPFKPKSFKPTAKSVMNARIAKKKQTNKQKKQAEKKGRLQKQLSENKEKIPGDME